MRRSRIALSVLAAVALATTAAFLTTGGSTAAPSRSQTLFKKMLLEDDTTTSAIKNLLGQRGGLVAPDVMFEDLTGDGRSDAIVLVETGGVAGAVALYVFSTDGESAESDLRAVYRSQRLYRASTAVSGAKLIVRTPHYMQGDDVCCPAKIVQREYTWSAGSERLALRSSEELPGPTG